MKCINRKTHHNLTEESTLLVKFEMGSIKWAELDSNRTNSPRKFILRLIKVQVPMVVVVDQNVPIGDIQGSVKAGGVTDVDDFLIDIKSLLFMLNYDS